MIEAVNLTERFDDIVAMDHIGAAIRDGSMFRLIGTSRARRSAFLRLVSGALKPGEGCIITDGHEIFENIPTRKRFFYILDEQYFSNNTIPEEMMCHYRKVYQEFDKARFHKLMGNLGLDEKRKIHTFSKDMKRQVSVICSVYTGTDYLLCDKTSGGLDPVMCQTVKSIFAADMKDRNLALVIASHNLKELEDIYDHVGLLYRGGVLLSKGLDDMKLNAHKMQCILRPDMKPEDLTSLGKVSMEQRGGSRIVTVRGSKGEVKVVMTSYEPVFFECIPLSLEEIFISEMEVAGYDIRKLIF